MPPKKPGRGFTLVELLIVVAIIGVLSMIGVPTYKRMVQKAKKAEAKVLLGGIYSVEAAFLSEFGAYGNVLDVMGYEPSGIVGVCLHSGTYIVGFFQPLPTCVITVPFPVLNPVVDRIKATLPSYYAGGCQGYFVPGAVNQYCAESGIPMDGSTFKATASGVIAPGIDRMNANSLQTDQWSIDNNRELINVYDGIQ